MVAMRSLSRLAAVPRAVHQLGSYSCWRSLNSKPSSGDESGTSSTGKKVKLSFGGLKAELDARADSLDAAVHEQKEFFSAPYRRDVAFPYYTDVCVIGGGAIGSSVAYNLKAMHSKLNVVVVERDLTFAKASTTLAVGGIRQQFSVPENIMMSQYGYDFIRNFKRHMAVKDTPPPEINFNPSGYVFAATEAGAENLRENYLLQRDYGVKVQLVGPEALKERFPWMNTEGIALASVGLQGEGWFDPWAFLYALRAKATFWGTQFVEGEATGFETEYWDGVLLSEDHITEFEKVKKVLVKVKTPSGETETRSIQAAYFVLAAGAHSAELALAAQIGKGKGTTRHKLPIEPRKRYVYTIHAPDGPGLDCPLFVDPTGMYFRREGLGGVYLAGMSPAPEHEPDASDLDTVDFSYFDEQIWPLLANRVPAFKRLKVRSGWAGFYDYNILDQNPIIGPHPYHPNVIFAGGFSGHGLQHSPATGRAVSELVYHGEYKTIDLSRFAYNRVMLNLPLREVNVV